MKNVRIYGNPPYTVAVVHGGPGAAGEMAPVARELASVRGILEPLQTADTIDGQLEELRAVLKECGSLPMTLIGFSWGAWLCCLFAARYPSTAGKLILVGSGPFEETFALQIMDTRLNRLDDEEKAELLSLSSILNDPSAENRTEAFARFGALFSKTDAYDPIPEESGETNAVDFRPDIHRSVWSEAADLRKFGRLLYCAGKVICPVTAIHGDYDPHPAEGVEKPLSEILPDFRFFLLKRCGHKPWIERHARDEFYRILKGELG